MNRKPASTCRYRMSSYAEFLTVQKQALGTWDLFVGLAGLLCNDSPGALAFFANLLGFRGAIHPRTMANVRRDRRPVKEQVKSGFRIAGKLVAAFCIAAVFYSGCALVQQAAGSSQVVSGWVLITLSIVAMAITVRFWAGGFVGFIAYAALRLLVGTLLPIRTRVPAARSRSGESVCDGHVVHSVCIAQIPHYPARPRLPCPCRDLFSYVSSADGLVQKRSSAECWQRRARVVVVGSPSGASDEAIVSQLSG